MNHRRISPPYEEALERKREFERREALQIVNREEQGRPWLQLLLFALVGLAIIVIDHYTLGWP